VFASAVLAVAAPVVLVVLALSLAAIRGRPGPFLPRPGPFLPRDKHSWRLLRHAQVLKGAPGGQDSADDARPPTGSKER